MNCRIVGAICQHDFAQAQRVLVSFKKHLGRLTAVERPHRHFEGGEGTGSVTGIIPPP